MNTDPFNTKPGNNNGQPPGQELLGIVLSALAAVLGGAAGRPPSPAALARARTALDAKRAAAADPGLSRARVGNHSAATRASAAARNPTRGSRRPGNESGPRRESFRRRAGLGRRAKPNAPRPPTRG